MHHRFLALLLIFSSLSAQEEIKPYLTSECDSLSLVEGVVNARNGKLVQIEQDITVQGSSPLQVTRYYDGGYHYNSRFGYGFGLSLPTHMRLRRKDGKLSIFVEQRMGSSVPYLTSLSLDKLTENTISMNVR